LILPVVTFIEAKQEIASLVAKYESLPTRTLNRYDEENTKKDFVLPLFHRLGWEVDNLTEVAAEERASNGRVDYAFKLGGVSRFYVEVKPLREDLGNRTDWAKQAITYAENKSVTWAILTNFKQLMLFNTEWDEPNLDRARFLNLTCHDYEADFAKLWWLSKESIEKGILNEEARKVGALKPKLPVEKSLYNQLLKWRTDLFNQIFHYQKDKGVNLRQTDELIQQFINRLVFIRYAEDRGIEENKLRAALHQWRSGGREGDLIDRIRDIFRNFASVYDSDLFPLLDAWDSVFVESDTLERIIDGLYERPTRLAGYDFAAIDADVLGAVYEQYLGYVAQVAQEQAKREAAQARLLGFEQPVFELEAKRLKRKQQGIYYTPKFVVDYIVRETVGRFLKERSHNEIVNIKILDPACGSGSFLIRAYDELLNYHAYQKGKVSADLDQWERRRILTGNIFGVDLDRQAVEIARLNLLLRSLSKQETLPSLTDRIRQGNSLISGSEEELRSYFGDNWQEKKPFNWETQFKDIMARGGFDVVIGNPPYVKVTSLDPSDRDYFMSHFETAVKRFDIYIGFIERGLKLLKDDGLFGFIIPYPFLSQDYAERLRSYVLEHCTLERIVDFSEFKVFADPIVRNIILILKKQADQKVRGGHLIQVVTPIHSLSFEEPSLRINAIPQSLFARMPGAMFRIDLDSETETVVSKIDSCSISLGTVAIASWGARGVPISVFHLDKPINEHCKPMIKGENIERYALAWTGKWFLYEPDKLYRPAFPELFESEKIVISKVTGDEGIISTYDMEGYYTDDSLCCCILKHRLSDKEVSFLGKRKIKILPEEVKLSRQYSLKYILGLINSKLLNFYFQKLLSYKLNVYPESIEQLPICHVDFDDTNDKKRHNDLVALVDRMLELNKRLAPIRNTACAEREELLRQIKQTDEEIDNLVYDLYGLTEEERKIVEEATKSQK
jgi:adenine-specific DNA-methyltransferase